MSHSFNTTASRANFSHFFLNRMRVSGPYISSPAHPASHRHICVEIRMVFPNSKYDIGTSCLYNSDGREIWDLPPGMILCRYHPANTAEAGTKFPDTTFDFHSGNLPPVPWHVLRHPYGHFRKFQSLLPKSGKVSAPACPGWYCPHRSAAASPCSACHRSKYEVGYCAYYPTTS